MSTEREDFDFGDVLYLPYAKEPVAFVMWGDEGPLVVKLIKVNGSYEVGESWMEWRESDGYQRWNGVDRPWLEGVPDEF